MILFVWLVPNQQQEVNRSCGSTFLFVWYSELELVVELFIETVISGKRIRINLMVFGLPIPAWDTTHSH